MFGEMIGFDGIAQKRHACNAIALEDSEVCVIPYQRMLLLTGELNPLKHRFFEFMSDEIVRCHGLITLLGSMNANQRLAAFLLNLLERQSAQGLSTTELILRMTRQEIASFLGLKLETVSRTLSKFSGMGLIKVNRRQIQAINSMQLQKIVT